MADICFFLVAPIIHCVRHAQVRYQNEVKQLSSANFDKGYHNLKVENHTMHDPSLTPYGEEQCRHLAKHFPYHKSVNLLVASPLRRTIYTALLAFEPEVQKGMKVIALPEAQETSDLPCDTGSDPEKLQKEMQNKQVDLSLVIDGWNSNVGKFAPDAASIERRASETRQWLKTRPEKEIVLVTHGGFLHYFTGDWSESCKFVGISAYEKLKLHCES